MVKKFFYILLLSFLGYGASYGCNQLCITEVYFDGNDEWIELYMSGNTSYSGEIIISGASSIPRSINISIGGGEFVLLTDKATIFTGQSFSLITGMGFQILDTHEIEISMYISGMVSDIFLVEQELVEQLNNNKQSFSKFGASIFPSNISINILSGYIANPAGLDIVEIQVEDYSSRELDTTGQVVSSGENELDRDQIERDNDPKFIPFVYPDIYITEIFPYDTSKFGEYIEILFDGYFSGELSIHGLGHGDARKNILVQASKGDRIIVTDQVTGTIHQVKYIEVPSISLTDGGEELIIYGQDGQVIDKVVYTKVSKDISVYFSSTSGQFREFTSAGDPTPGVSQEFVEQLCKQEELISSCSIQLQHTNPIYSHNKLNLVAILNTKKLSNDSVYQCFRSGGMEGLTGCNPNFTSISTSGIWDISLQILENNKLICATTSQINAPDKPHTESCREAYYDGLYHKRKDRFEFLKGNIKTYGYSVSSSGVVSSPYVSKTKGESLDLYSGLLQILQVLPNPEGKDTLTEGVELYNLTSGSINISGLKLYNGRSTKLLPNKVIGFGEKLKIYGSFGLTNKPTCIQLQSNEQVYSSVCYGKVREGEWIIVTPNTLNEEQTSQLVSTEIKEFDERVCIVSNGVTSKCLALSDLGYYKKIAKEASNIEKLEDKLVKEKDKYAKLKKSTDEKYARLRALKDSLSSDLKKHKSYKYMIDDFIYENWRVVYNDTNFQKIRRLLRDGGESYGITYLGVSLEDKYLLESNIVPIGSLEYSQLVDQLLLYRKGLVDTLGESLIVTGSLVPP